MSQAVSFIQKQFYINYLMCPKDTSYHIVSLFKIKGEVDRVALEGAANHLLKKYDVLRYSFLRKGRDVLYEVNDNCVITLTTTNIDSAYEDVNINAIHSEIHTPFNLEEAPLIRMHLFVFKNGMSVLSIVFHHIIIDLHSKQVFGNELSALYNKAITGKELQTESISITYSDYAERERTFLEGKEAEKMMGYYQNVFNETDYLTSWPLKKERPVKGSKKGRRIHFTIDKGLSERIRDFSKANTIAPFTLLMSAFVLLCRNVSQQDKVVLGIPLSNRRKKENKDVFGPLVNIVPILINLKNTEKDTEVVSQVRRGLLMAHRNQEIPFIHLIENLNLKRSFSYNPLFQAGFTSEPPMHLTLDKVEITPLCFEREGAQLDLFYTYWEEQDEFRGYLEYSTDLFYEDKMQEWIEVYKSLIQKIVY
nr:condensation domain-containing protein [uncultured Carboxylicivirga sp.]